MQSQHDAPQRPLPSACCPFCADSHSRVPPVVQDRDTDDPFALPNLLPAGTIAVTVHDGESPCPSASKYHTWHSLPVRSLSTHPVDTLFKELEFLTEHLFLRATCRLGDSGRIIFIRVYLIPNDLPNVRGRLHHRSETVVKEAKRHLRNTLLLVEQNHGLWEADESCLDAPQKHLLSGRIDNRTMAEIYSDLPSPVLGPVSNENTRLAHRIAAGYAIWGLRSTLHGYQRHSVAVMLHRESSTSPDPDPLFLPVSSMSDARFYIQPSTMVVLRECPTYSPSHGGLLCEELGTGKTVMIIALILVTASQLADPEQSLTDERTVMTPLAYRYFPSSVYDSARQRAGLDQKPIRRVPSLVELLIHYFSSFKPITGRPAFADELEASHLWPFIQVNKPFYHEYQDELRAGEYRSGSRRAICNQYPRVMYLSSATLVIVPVTLLGHWKAEIDKHCHDFVRYLIARPSSDLPDARKLATEYDLVVMSTTYFSKESCKNNVAKLYNLKPCTCPCLVGSRVPDCRCRGDLRDVSPLLQVRWKRLVIDEGHITGNPKSSLNRFADMLSIQHKWIITGTPTSNILGLQLGRATEEESGLNHSQSDDYPTPTDDDEVHHVRIWGEYDRSNLRKLGTMIGEFLGVPQFNNGSRCFTDHVSKSLCDPQGPLPGAIDVLNRVMQMVMVRHSIEDVENDIVLPPMKHDMIYMDLDSYALKSYNAMQAGVAINAVDSEREGQDYLFHPSKTKELQTAVNNSSQGLFWSASDILYNVAEICGSSVEYVTRALGRPRIGPEDVDLLKQAIHHACVANKDEIWKGIQSYPDVPFRIYGLDPDILEAWTRTGLYDKSRSVALIHPDRLASLRALVRTNPLISKRSLIEKGNNLNAKEECATESKSLSSREARQRADQMKEMVREVQWSIEALQRRMHESEDGEPGDDREDVRPIYLGPRVRVTRPSPLSGVKVGPSLSTKLNYILSEVLRYSAKEKFLIFSRSLLTLSQIGEALSLFEIKHLAYTNRESCLLREQCVMTFETSDTHRVLLMDLKLGARGLNLISASRIIFCEPVWHPDVESQAIKRAHRIGQTKSVTVKTLVIRSTAEEAMVVRRQYLRGNEKIPNMEAEVGMREYLQNPRFLTEPAPDDLIDVVLYLDDTRPTDVGGSDNAAVDLDISSSGFERPEDGPVRKRVRFEE